MADRTAQSPRNTTVGRRGSIASAKRAIAWWERSCGGKKRHSPADKTRRNGCRNGERGHFTEGCVCQFLCRGCNRWTPWEDGGGAAGPEGFACSRCSGRIYMLEGDKYHNADR